MNAHGGVDYRGLASNGKPQLDQLLTQFDTLDPTNLDDANKTAAYINLYNAGMMSNILRYISEKSMNAASPEFLKLTINDIKVPDGNIWNGSYKVALGGKKLTLDEIEHGLIRAKKFDELGAWRVSKLDPRIHSAVNCAAVSCPRVREVAYRAETISKMLDENMREFLNSDEQFKKLSDSKMQANSIVLWYYTDFDEHGKSLKTEGAGDYLATFIDDAKPDSTWKKKHLTTNFNDRSSLALRVTSSFSFQYDWRVNDQRNKP